MALKKTQRSIVEWGNQNWRTKSGKRSQDTDEPYLPSAAYRNMKDRTYEAAKAAKEKATAEGKQYAKHGLHKGKKR